MVKHDIDYAYIRPGKLKKVSEWALPLVVFSAAFSFYISRMAPSILWGDMTDFSTAAYIYDQGTAVTFPLYTFMSRVALLIPGLEPAFSTNLLSALFGAISVMLFYLLIKRLFQIPVMHWNYRNLPSYKKLLEENPDYSSIDEIIDIERIAKPSLTELPSLGAAILFGLSLPIWLASVRADVYALQTALIMASLFFITAGVQGERSRLFFLGLWFYFLSFTNNPLMSLAFAPAVLFIILADIQNIGNWIGTILASVILLAAAVSCYFYLPIHQAFETAVSNGSAQQGSFLSSMPILQNLAETPLPELWPMYLERLKALTYIVAEQIEWPMLALSLFGMIGLFQLSRKIFWFFFWGFLFNLGFAVWFNGYYGGGFDAINLLAPMVTLLLIFAMAGTLYLMRTRIIANKSSLYMALIAGVFIYGSVTNNWFKGDLSEADGPDQISKAILGQLPEDALLVVRDRNLIQPLWYNAYVTGSRNDLAIVSSEEISEPQKRKEIMEKFPQLIYNDNFLADDSIYNDYYAADLCWRNSDQHDVYIQYGVYGFDHRHVTPEGLLYRYIGLDTNRVYPAPDMELHYSLIDRIISDSLLDLNTREVVARWLFLTGLYCDNTGGKNKAWDAYNRALSIDMRNTEMRLRMAGSLASAGKYREALKYVSDALAIDPQNSRILDLGRRIVDRMKKSEMASKE